MTWRCKSAIDPARVSIARRNLPSAATEAASVTAAKEYAHEEPIALMSAVVDRPNMLRAYARVCRNKGAAG